MTRWGFISEHAAEFGVQRLCRVLKVARSGFYAWQRRAAGRAARRAADVRLTERIRQAHEQSWGAYGVPRITAELRGQGVRVNHKRVWRLMRTAGIVGVHLRRGRRTTVSDPEATRAPDLLQRDFTARQVNERWVGDITYLRAGDRWVYLATVLDLHSRRLVGWSLADHLRAELVQDALQAAVALRGGKHQVQGVLFHADHGTQYTSRSFADTCHDLGVTRSMGTIGDSLDNAAAESFFATLKRELGTGWETRGQARLAITAWIGFYNHHRRHSTLGYHSPATYEMLTTTTRQEPAATAAA